MSDVGISNELAIGLFLGVILDFLIGFIPGFYLSYLFITKLVKKTHLYFILFYFISGILLSHFISDTIYSGYDSHNTFWSYFANSLPFIVLLEIVAVAWHFFYFRKRKQKHNK